MKAMTYLVLTNIKATLRYMKKKKGQIVLWVFLIAVFVMMIFTNNNVNESANWVPDEYLSTAFAALVILVAGFTISNGIKKGSSSYRKADVMFVFPSPVSPRLILIYGFLKQLGISVLVVLWFVFQSVNVRNIFGYTAQGFYLFLIPVFFVVLYMPVSSMLIYSTTLRKEGSRKIFERIALFIGAIAAAAFIYFTVKFGDPLEAAAVLIGGGWFEYVPILGWLVALLKGAKFGFTMWTWTAMGLLIAGLALILWRLLSSEIPFYEEVLKQTEERERLIEQKRSGGSNMNLGPKKARKASIEYKKPGPKAIFYRQLLEFKKAGFLFADKTTLIMMVIGVAGGFLLKKNHANIALALYAAIYLNFLFSFGGKWIKELSTPFVYLMPGSALSKLWYATAANHIKHTVDGAAVFIPIMIITGSDPVLTIGMIFAYASIAALFIYSEVLSRRLFGAMYKSIMANLLKILFIMILTAPAITAFAVMTSVPALEFIAWTAPIAVVAYCSLISLLIMLFGKKIFSDAELA